MKKIFLLLILGLLCSVIYGQTDTIKLSDQNQFRKLMDEIRKTDHRRGPDITLTFYPKNGLIYDQYVGETIAGYTLANGWRRDTLNGGFNKKEYGNPYIFSLEFRKKNTAFYRYKNGKKYNGKILDTLMLRHSVERNYYNRRPYGEEINIKTVFQADCIDGMLQGVGTLIALDTNTLLAQCYFENGEIVGDCISWHLDTKRKTVTSYKKGNNEPINQFEMDKFGDVIQPYSRGETYFEKLYQNLIDPFRGLSKGEKAELLSENSNDLKQLMYECVSGIGNYFDDRILGKTPNRILETKLGKMKEYEFENLKLKYFSFDEEERRVLECYLNDKLILIGIFMDFLQPVSPEKFFLPDSLFTIQYDKKGNIAKVSKFLKKVSLYVKYYVYYDETSSYTNFKPLSIYTSKKEILFDSKNKSKK